MTELSPASFEGAYQSTPPWEIGRPQDPFLGTTNLWRGRVLDAGCGTGELAIAAAARGLDATGIDGAPSAISIARKRATARGLAVDFVVGDVLRLPEFVPGSFDLVFDSGCFHVFNDVDRERYVDALRAATASGSRLMLLCFSDAEPGDWGPRRVRRVELEAAFAHGWTVESIESAVFVLADLPSAPPSVQAWFARFTRD